MGHNESVLEVHGSDTSNAPVRGGSAGSFELRILEFQSLEDIQKVLQRYDSLNVPKHNRQQFQFHLTQDRNAWFLEIGDVGLVYFTQVLPSFTATIHVLMWDGHLGKERVSAVRKAMQMAAERFQLERIGAQIKWKHVAMRDFLKRAGMVWEGTVRKGWADEKGVDDALLLGVIKEEL